MRKILAALTVALTLLAGDLVWSSAVVEAQTSPEPLLQEVVIGFDHGFLPDLGVGQLLEGLPISMRSEQGSFLVLQVPNLAVVRRAFSLLPGISYVEKNATMKALAIPTDPRYGSQYGPAMMGLPAAWGSIGYGSSSIKVATIDSGALQTHEDLGGSRIATGYDYISNDAVPNDTCGHGTHVAGIIGATVNNGVGVAGASQATIIPMKGLAVSSGLFSSGDCSGTNAQIANAIYGAINAGANIISMSIGGGASSAIQQALIAASNAGIVLVAAAGNDGSTNGIDYPGAYDNVIAVGALDASKSRASYSDRGPQLDIMAPGSSILSSYSSNNSSYATMSGTSMATPAVSGAIALAMSCMPNGTTVAQITAKLYSSAEDLGTAGYDTTYGNGLVRADKLVQALCPDAPPPPNNNPIANFTATQSGALGVSVNAATSSDPDADPLTYAWNFGDGGTATGVNPAPHTYASTGTYAITLNIADGRGGTATLMKTFQATGLVDPDPATATVVSGQNVALTLGSGTLADQFRKIYVPPGTNTLTVQLSGPACSPSCNPDGDLYTQVNVKPTNTKYACRPYLRGPNEICTKPAPQSGWWYLRVRRRIGAGPVNLVATLS